MDDAKFLEEQKQSLKWTNQKMADRAALLEKVKNDRTQWEQKPLEQINDQEWKRIALRSSFFHSRTDVVMPKIEAQSIHYNGRIRMRREMQTRYPAVLPAQTVKETLSERFEEKTSAGKRKFQRGVVFTDLHTKEKNARKLEDEKNKRSEKIAAARERFYPSTITEGGLKERELTYCKAAFSMEGNSSKARRINEIVNGGKVGEMSARAKQECIRQFLALDLNFDFRTDTAVARQAGRLEDLAVKIDALKTMAKYSFMERFPYVEKYEERHREEAEFDLGAYAQSNREKAEFNAKFEWAQNLIEYYNHRKVVISDNCYRSYKNSELSMNLAPLSPEEQKDAAKRADYDDKKRMIDAIVQADLCRGKLLSQSMPKGVTLFFLQQEEEQKESAREKRSAERAIQDTEARIRQKREEAKDKVSCGAKNIVDLELSVMRLEQDKKEADALLALKKQELEDKKRKVADTARYAFNMAKLNEESAWNAVEQAVLETSARKRTVRALQQDESKILENKKEAVTAKEKNLNKIRRKEKRLNVRVTELQKQFDDKKTGYAAIEKKKEGMESKVNTHEKEAYDANLEMESHVEQIRKLNAEIKQARLEQNAKTVGEITQKNEKLIEKHEEEAKSAGIRRIKELEARRIENEKLQKDKEYEAILEQWEIARDLGIRLSIRKASLSELQRDKKKAKKDLHAAKKELEQIENTAEENKKLSEKERQEKRQTELDGAQSELDKAQKEEEAARDEYKRKREVLESSRPERTYRKEQEAFDEASKEAEKKTSAWENARKSLQEANEQIKAQTTAAQMTQQEAESLIKKEREDRKEDFDRENLILQARNELMKAQEDFRKAQATSVADSNSPLAQFMPNKDREKETRDKAKKRLNDAQKNLKELTGETSHSALKTEEFLRPKKKA